MSETGAALILAVENFVLFNSVLAVIGFVLTSAVRFAVKYGFLKLSPFGFSKLYTAALAAPPITALWLVCVSFAPEIIFGKTDFAAAHTAPLHELHLLGQFTERLEPTLAFAVTGYFLIVLTVIACLLWRGHWQVGNIIGKLDMNAPPPPAEQLALTGQIAARHNVAVGLVMSNYPLTFLWGFGRSKLVVSSGLLCALTREELAGVLEHEIAHHLRRDNLAKLILNFCSWSSLVFPLTRLIYQWRASEVELICDEIAAAQTALPLEIAHALVKLRQQTRTSKTPRNLGEPLFSRFFSSNARLFENRVVRLLTLGENQLSPRQIGAMRSSGIGGTLIFGTLLFASLVCFLAFAPLTVHRAAEMVINFFG